MGIWGNAQWLFNPTQTFSEAGEGFLTKDKTSLPVAK